MSSYYVDGLLSKYTTGSSLFPNVERASCSIGPSGEDYGSARTAAAIAFAPSLSGVYSVNNAVYQSHPVFTSGYGQGQDAHTLHCSLFDQSRLFTDSCYHQEPGPLTSLPDKQYRMYPWMRASDEWKEPRCVTDPREPQFPSWDSAGYFPPSLAVFTCQLPPPHLPCLQAATITRYTQSANSTGTTSLSPPPDPLPCSSVASSSPVTETQSQHRAVKNSITTPCSSSNGGTLLLNRDYRKNHPERGQIGSLAINGHVVAIKCGPDALQDEDRVSGGLVDVDSVDELCGELLHIPGTQIQCAISDMERKHDLDVMADGEEHGHAVIGGASHVTRQLCTFDRE
ncbi:Homeobox protein Hox-A7 [Larimichthys crocea]|uniref:Uncharacterized protein n=1 Tax=Larimichthys crocea TaxID=215358 RepID=A0ACD3RJD4_LARCR|nr:Homeobox protein Hox-A7 [Larimichthys crocea]